MPCDSSHMEANRTEKEMSQVVCLIDEINGREWTKEEWQGYHPRVYCKHLFKESRDAMVAELCAAIQAINPEDYSLELQIWWRDHKVADKKRLEDELKQAQNAADREKAIAKLTPHERKLLGV